MPLKVNKNLPAAKTLEQENIFVMDTARAETQDIRPLRIAVLNLMPTKEITETQLLRLIGNSPLQVEVVLMHTATYASTNTAAEHLKSFYKTFDEVRHMKFDGLIITGAPVERMDFAEVAYWEELKNILSWADKHVYSTLYICWAAQAGLYYHYNINKYMMDDKISGVFAHGICDKFHPLMRGFDETFFAPHSRHTAVSKEDIMKADGLEVLAESSEAGVYLVASKDLRHVFITGHAEYDPETLHLEYMRDVDKGMELEPPAHYYKNDRVGEIPPISWRAHAMLLFNNWLNYCVYQNTPYNYLDEK